MAHRVLIGTRKGLVTVERTGASWTVTNLAFLGDHIPMLLADPRDGTIYASQRLGHFGSKLQRSHDGGKTWEECAVPTYPQQPEGEPDKDMWGKLLPWKLDTIWALEAGHASELGVLWCGTIPGGLFRSTDGSNSWQLVESLWYHPMRKGWFGGGADLPGIHSICVDPRDPKRVKVGISCGGVWGTDDGGASWACQAQGMWAAYMPPESKFDPNIQDPHRMVQCRAQPECFWVQHHNGIFRSTDGAASWQEVSNAPGSVAGFPVAVHPNDPDTAWFVPMMSDERRVPPNGQVTVNRTRDGGKTFEVLRNGLPQQHSYDLAFRHNFELDSTGNCLALGSTTGSLWISENQGDSWQTVSEHLPQIYCVRWD